MESLAIKEVKEALKIPVIGNGDILTHFEATDRKNFSGVDGVMLGRGALIKPWLFKEIAEGTTLNYSAKERLQVFFLLTQFLKDHFRDDEKGIKRIMQFLPWHFAFFHRYQYLPAASYHAESKEHPLLQSRIQIEASNDPIEMLLSCDLPEVHEKIATMLLAVDENSLMNAAFDLAEQEAPQLLSNNQNNSRQNSVREESVNG